MFCSLELEVTIHCGPSRFNSVIYQHCWHLLGDEASMADMERSLPPHVVLRWSRSDPSTTLGLMGYSDPLRIYIGVLPNGN
jgi:hypothetical protein